MSTWRIMYSVGWMQGTSLGSQKRAEESRARFKGMVRVCHWGRACWRTWALCPFLLLDSDYSVFLSHTLEYRVKD